MKAHKKADHILKMAGLGIFCDNFFRKFFKYKLAKLMPQTISNVKDDY